MYVMNNESLFFNLAYFSQLRISNTSRPLISFIGYKCSSNIEAAGTCWLDPCLFQLPGVSGANVS